MSCRSWSGAPSREVATSAGGWLRPDLAFFKGIPEKLDQKLSGPSAAGGRVPLTRAHVWAVLVRT